MFTLLKLGSGVPSGGLSKPTGSSSSLDRGGGRCGGLEGPLGRMGDSWVGCSFTSGPLGEGSRVLGDRARLACRDVKIIQMFLLQNNIICLLLLRAFCYFSAPLKETQLPFNVLQTVRVKQQSPHSSPPLKWAPTCTGEKRKRENRQPFWPIAAPCDSL